VVEGVGLRSRLLVEEEGEAMKGLYCCLKIEVVAVAVAEAKVASGPYQCSTVDIKKKKEDEEERTAVVAGL